LTTNVKQQTPTSNSNFKLSLCFYALTPSRSRPQNRPQEDRSPPKRSSEAKTRRLS